MMRRLPVYLLLDVSSSMSGEPIEAVKAGLDMLINTLRKDPQALEAAYLSVITFASEAKQVIPLTELMKYQAPNLSVGGCTEMGAALKLLADCLEREIRKSSPEQKGDWKPIVFLLTDGEATDDIEKGIKAIREKSFASFVACAAGYNANVKQLQRITETVVSLDTTSSNDIAKFFAWISASIQVSSRRVDSGRQTSGLEALAPPPAEIKLNLDKF